MSDGDYFIDRKALGAVFKDPRVLIAFDALQRRVLEGTPNEIAALQAAPFVTYQASDTLTADRVLTGSTGVTVDLTADDIARIVVDVAMALGFVPARQTDVTAIEAAPVVLSAPNAAFPSGVSVAAALGYTPANDAAVVHNAGGTMTGALDVQALLQCDSLRIDQAATVSVATVTHSVPVSISGVTYYLLVSNVP